MRSVAIPTEHGGWNLTAEPVLLALLVTWSSSGLTLGLASLGAFVARTPAKVVAVDLWRRRWLDRSRVAAVVAAVEVAVVGALAAVATATAVDAFWVPLAAAAPLVAVELWFEMRSRGRRLVPELCGAVGIGSVAAAITLAGGGDALVAFGLWAVVAARSIAAIPYARVQLARGRGRAHRRWHSDIAQGIAVALVVAAWWWAAVPPASVGVIAAAGLLDVLLVRIAPRPAVLVGLQQMAVGIAIVGVTAVALTVAP